MPAAVCEQRNNNKTPGCETLSESPGEGPMQSLML